MVQGRPSLGGSYSNTMMAGGLATGDLTPPLGCIQTPTLTQAHWDVEKGAVLLGSDNKGEMSGKKRSSREGR